MIDRAVRLPIRPASSWLIYVAALCGAAMSLQAVAQVVLPRPRSAGVPVNEQVRSRSMVPGGQALPPATGPRRYALNLASLIDRREGGEIQAMGSSQISSNKPVPLTVMRQSGYRGEWSSVPLQGLESQPPFLNCRYELIDRTNPGGADIIQRDVKFWYQQRPGVPSASLYAALIELKIADVAVESCPANWGQALSAAMGEDVWAQVQVRANPNLAKAQAESAKRQAEAAAQQAAAALAASQLATTSESGRPLSPVERCDRSAAHAEDPEALAEGVTDAQLDVAFVTAACEEALKLDPGSPRLAFQLARAYIKANRLEDAVEKLLLAANQGHGGALAYLADLHIDGAPGIEADPLTARLLYEKAAQAGFEPAKKVLAEFEDYTERLAAAEKEEKSGSATVASGGRPPLPHVPPGTQYRVSRVIDNIMKGDLNAVAYTEPWSKYYLIEVASTIGYFCQAEYSQEQIQDLNRRAALSDIDMSSGGGMVVLLNAAERLIVTMANPALAAELERREEMAGEEVILNRAEEAAHDGIVFLSRNGCAGEAMKTFKVNAANFIDGADSPRLNADTVFKSCNVHNNKSNSRLGMEFCACITRKLANARMTRAERIGLMTNFPPAAQSIVNKQLDDFQSCR